MRGSDFLLPAAVAAATQRYGLEGMTPETGPRVWRRGWDISFRCREVPRSVRETQEFLAVSIAGSYLNVRLNPAWASEVLRQATFEVPNAEHVALEHTSLTPAYPVNIATLRSSYVGDAIARALQLVGHQVSTRYFMEDECWHVGVVADSHQKWTHLKPDHAVGRALAKAMFLRRSTSAQDALAGAVRLFPELEVRSYGDDDRFPDAASACLEGILETLQRNGTLPQEVDRESTFLESVTTRDVNAVADRFPAEHLPAGILRPFRKDSYVVRSARYFAVLLSKYERVIPVVSVRQEVQIRSAAFWGQQISGTGHERVTPVLFEQVYFNGKTDSISLRRFHSADGALAELGRELGTRPRVASDLLRLAILSQSLRKPVHLVDGSTMEMIASSLGRQLFKSVIHGKVGAASRPTWPAGAPVVLEQALVAPHTLVQSMDPRLAVESLRELALMSGILVRDGYDRGLVQKGLDAASGALGVGTLQLGV